MAKNGTNDNATEAFVFVLVPDFSMMSLSSAVEPLRSLNRLMARPGLFMAFCRSWRGGCQRLMRHRHSG